MVKTIVQEPVVNSLSARFYPKFPKIVYADMVEGKRDGRREGRRRKG